MGIAESALNNVKIEPQQLALLKAEHLIRISETTDKDEIETFHDRVREAIVNSLPPKVLKAYQKRLAVSMELSGEIDAETLAFHFQGSGELERAAYYSVKAANLAFEKLAFDRAARLYQMALSFNTLEENEIQRTRKKLGDALVNAGRGTEAAQVFISAAKDATTAESLELEHRGGEQFLRSGEFDKGLKIFGNILKSIGMRLPKTPGEAIPLLLFHRLHLKLRGLKFNERKVTEVATKELSKIDVTWSLANGIGDADLVRGSYFQTINLLLALKAGEPYRVSRALILEAVYSAASGGKSYKRTRKLFQIASKHVEECNQPYLFGLFDVMEALAGYLEGRWKDYHDSLKKAKKIFEHCKGVAMEIDMTYVYSLICLRYMGDLKGISNNLPNVLKEVHQRGDSYALANLQTLVSPFLSLAKDDPVQALNEINETLNQWGQQSFYMQHWYGLWGEAESILYQGEGTSALNLVNDNFSKLKKAFLLNFQINLITAMELRSRCAIAAANEQNTLSEQSIYLNSATNSIKKIERENMPHGNAFAKLLQAGVTSIKGNVNEATKLLTEAESAFEACDMLLYAAVARRRYGQLIGGDKGHSLIQASEEWMKNQGIKNPERMSAMMAPGKWS